MSNPFLTEKQSELALDIVNLARVLVADLITLGFEGEMYGANQEFHYLKDKLKEFDQCK